MLAALVNAVVLLVVCGYLLWPASAGCVDPQQVEAGPMVAFAAVGLVANGVSLAVLTRAERGSLNLRGATNEVFADLLGSVLARGRRRGHLDDRLRRGPTRSPRC